MTIAFFHQNEVQDAQGGIERFLATLLDQAQGQAYLVTEKTDRPLQNRLALPLPYGKVGPQWVRYILSALFNIRSIRAFLREKKISAIEFSRPEYALFGILLPGRKTFTFHGTGPLRKEKLKWLLHFSACWLLPLCADAIQIVGRNPNGLPRLLQRAMKDKLHFVEAWYDDCFAMQPYPPTEGPIRIFYAGRLATAKNPELLFAVMREIAHNHSKAFLFVYCGADGVLLPEDLTGSIVEDLGLLTAPQLAKAIASCHFGILTSHTEGSPFIVVESLACGRGFLLPPIPGLLAAYGKQTGVAFAQSYNLSDYINALLDFAQKVRSGLLPADIIADNVKARAKSVSSQAVLKNIIGQSYSAATR